MVLEQGIDTTTPAGRSLFHVIGAMDQMLADLISEGTRQGLETARARGRTGGRKPKLTQRQAAVAQQMYDDKGEDGKRSSQPSSLLVTRWWLLAPENISSSPVGCWVPISAFRCGTRCPTSRCWSPLC